MPTVLQRAKAFKAMMEGENQAHGTNTHGEPLYMPKNDSSPRGQILGSKPKERRSTPPDSQPSNNLDRTPPPHQKVLPWVAEIQTEGYQAPEGMFGPYDSQPPTRPQTMVDAPISPPQGRAIHPFAYEAGGSLPFAALSGAQTPRHQAEKQHVTRESEVMSRGAGMRALASLGPPIGLDSGDRSGSIGMGTFGQDGTRGHTAVIERSDSPRKSQIGRTYGKAPCIDPSTPPSPIAKSVASPAKRIPVPDDRTAPAQPHIHPPHHDYPFSHAEAAQKQKEAMAEARAQALAQLEAADQGASMGVEQNKPSGGPKGPRRTYETSTSGPSFGHILHHNGLPIGMPGPALPPGFPQSVPMSRDLGGNNPFMRIPFGVPMGASIQRPLFVMRNSVGVGMGVGLGGQGLQGPTYGIQGSQKRQNDSPLSTAARAKDARSAYVETIEDEQAQTGTNKTPTGRATPWIGPDPSLHAGHNPSSPTVRAQTVPGGTAGPELATNGQDSHGHRVTSGHTHAQIARSHHSHSPAQQQHDDDRTIMGDAAPLARSRPVSMTPTTASNVKKLVAESKYHDETLCQLLDAAQLNLIGKEAKRALNRAARTRITELKELRAHGEGGTHDWPPSKKSRGRKSKDKHGRRSESRTSEVQEPPELDNPGPPAWANEIMSRLEAFDARFSKLEKQEHNHPFFEQFGADGPPSHEIAGDILDDLIYNELGPEFGQLMGLQRGVAQLPAIGSNMPSQHHGYGYQNQDQNVNFATIHSYAPTMQSQGQKLARSAGQGTGYRASSGNGDLIWGSEVELPAPEETVPPPRPGGPTINVQPPTESNIGKSSYRVPSGPTYSQGTPRTPPGMPKGRDIVFEAPGGVIHHRERDLPAAPSESMLSQRQSPVPQPDSMPAMTNSDGATPRSEAGRLPRGHDDQTRFHPSTAYETAPTMPKSILQPMRTYVTPPRQQQEIGLKRGGDDGTHTDGRVEPWSLITQKLYSWALVWEEETFIRALERISLGHQVEEFSLTIFMMMTYKRLIRHNLTSTPSRSCDKLFVPPTIAAAINAAVHNKQFDNAAQFLAELWESYQLSDEPPRVIISLAKHRNENDLWTAHRFDLTSHHLTSYGISHDEQNLKDGRPFMWWYAIRLAWPQCKIPDPFDAGLQVRFEHVRTAPEDKSDNSLVAANMARNLLLGYRPERPTDLAKMRELTWAEVKRLMQKKKSGRLVVDPDSTDHTFDVYNQ